MAQEIEIKLTLDDPDGLRARLAELGAACDGRIFEINTIFDTSGGRLRAAGMALRVRAVWSLDRTTLLRAVLTLKRPATGNTGSAGDPPAGQAVKTREEVETALADPTAGTLILTSLGYEPVIVYEKIRETWRYADCTIEIDELPHMGRFVEIEGPSARAIEGAASQLALDTAAVIHETYIALAAAAGERVDGRRELRFPVN